MERTQTSSVHFHYGDIIICHSQRRYQWTSPLILLMNTLFFFDMPTSSSMSYSIYCAHTPEEHFTCVVKGQSSRWKTVHPTVFPIQWVRRKSQIQSCAGIFWIESSFLSLDVMVHHFCWVNSPLNSWISISFSFLSGFMTLENWISCKTKIPFFWRERLLQQVSLQWCFSYWFPVNSLIWIINHPFTAATCSYAVIPDQGEKIRSNPPSKYSSWAHSPEGRQLDRKRVPVEASHQHNRLIPFRRFLCDLTEASPSTTCSITWCWFQNRAQKTQRCLRYENVFLMNHLCQKQIRVYKGSVD